MTQFVPVWSGTRLHSRRLARLQLLLVAGGLVGFLVALLTGRLALLPIPALVLLGGFWTFVYNVGRSLSRVRPLDTTERHFAFALACLLVVTAAGFLLAVDYTRGILPAAHRSNLVAAHATLAVLGVVLATIAGASYQLAAMFTQTEIAGVDARLQGVETVAYPTGVSLLAVGRLVDVVALARVGGRDAPRVARPAAVERAQVRWRRGESPPRPRCHRLARRRDALSRRPVHRLGRPIQRRPRTRTRSDDRRPLRRPPGDG
jgi:uncharacterized membrane protein (DUF485 family)